MPEFVLLAVSLAVALFGPFLDGDSVATLLWRAMQEWFRAQSFLISIQ
jgi:hypothetical protein